MNQAELEILELGERIVVSFGELEILDQIDVGQCRQQLTSLVREHNCKTISFNVLGVKVMPSGMLGVVASMRDLGVAVQVYNPSDDVREVLDITNIATMIEILEGTP